MAKHTTCDRCGNDTQNYHIKITVPYTGNPRPLELDFCVICLRELHDFVRPIKKN